MIHGTTQSPIPIIHHVGLTPILLYLYTSHNTILCSTKKVLYIAYYEFLGVFLTSYNDIIQ